MGRFFNLMRFYGRRLITSKFYMGLFIFFTILFLTRFYFRMTDQFGRTDYGNLIGEMMVVIHALFLGYMVYFYKLFSDELKYGVHSFFADSSLIIMQKISAITLVHAFFQFLFYSFTVISLLLFYTVVGIPINYFYVDSAFYIMIYYAAPMVIAQLIGVLLAFLFGKKKVSFFIILLVWLFIGPLNTHLFPHYFRQVEAGSLETFFYIGVMNSNIVYKSFLGYDYSAGSLWKLLAWLSSLTILIMLCCLKNTLHRKERLRSVMIIGISLVLAGISLSAMTATNSKAFSYADGDSETEYYQYDHAIEPDLSYEIEYYNIDLDDVITAKIGFKSLHTSTPSFQLHHSYLVQEVRDQAGNQLSFNQKGDFIQVSTGKTESLTFVYELGNSHAQPLLHGNYFLTSAKGWYPRKISGSVFSLSTEYDWYWLSINHFYHEPVSFTLRSKEGLFTNINQTASGSYEGIVDGLTVLKGNYLRTHTGEYQIIYPADWNEKEYQFKEFIDSMELAHQQIQTITGMDVPAIPKQLLLSSGHGETHYQTNLLIYYTDSLYPIDAKDSTQYLLPKKMLEAFVLTSLFSTAKERENLYEWVDLSSLAIAERLGLSQGMLDQTYFSIEATEDELKLANEVYDTFFSLTEDEQNEFLKIWLKKIEVIGTDWSKISSLMEGVTQHENGS